MRPLPPLQNDVIRIAKIDFSKNYELSKLVNIFLQTCSERTDNEEYIKEQLTKEMESF